MSEYIQILDSGLPKVVVIGGGFGGLQMVKSLKKLDVQVILFDKSNHHTFQPLLYQVATSGLETSSIIYPFRKAFNKQKNFFFRLGEVNHINTPEQTIETSIGKLRYDYLIIASGATTNYYGMKDIEEKAFPLKTIEDSINLRNHILRNLEKSLLVSDKLERNSLIDYVIVGGGPTGVEVAGALAELKRHVFPQDYPEMDVKEDMDIHLIEATGKLLGAMSEESSRKALEYLQDMGVKVHLNTSVKSYDGMTVELGSGEKLVTQTLVWGAGVAGDPIAGLHTESYVRGGRIKVNAFNQVEGYQNIFAIGDVAAMISEKDPRGHPMLAQPAIQQAKQLGKNLQRMLKGKTELVPFEYKDLGTMATIGRNKAVVDLKHAKFQGFFAWLVWIFVHLMALVGFRNRIFVFFNWFSSYFSYDKSNRLIIGKPGSNLAEEKTVSSV